MRPNRFRPSRLAPALVLVSLAAGAALATAPLGGTALAASGQDAARCELRVARQGGTVALTALAHADEPVSGRYALRVSGPGTAIRQGGDFRAAPGRPATLGAVTIGTPGRGAKAELDLVIDGRTTRCETPLDGAR